MAQQRSIKDFFNRTSSHRERNNASITAVNTATQQNDNIDNNDVHETVANTRNCHPSTQNTRHGQHYKVPEIPSILLKYHPDTQFVFPKQQTGPSRNRSVQHKWFTSFNWLHYDVEHDYLLCYDCIKACQLVSKTDTAWYSDAEMAFLIVGFRNWKDALVRFTTHQKSDFHQKCHNLIRQRTTANTVESLLLDQYTQQQKTAKICLMAIISSIRYLARSGNALRGHDLQGGNLRLLLEERSLDIPELVPWLERRDNYLSADIQNEILEIMAHTIFRILVKEIKLSPRFSIIADGTTDCSGKEQFSVCIRFVDPDSFAIHEVFVGLYNPDDSRGSTLAAVIKDVLLRLTLPLPMLCGECFDGARNMSGKNKGVQKILHDEQPNSIHVHCLNHSLDLALQEVAKENDQICNVLCIVKDSSYAILESSKRRKVYENVVLPATEDEFNEKMHNLIAMCPTRWCVRSKALVRYRKEYARILETLQKIIDEPGAISPERKATVRGWLNKLFKFETLFYLNVSIEIFSPCETLARALQSPKQTAAGVLQSVQILISQLESMRTSTAFQKIYAATTDRATALKLNFPTTTRAKKVPKRFEQTTNAVPSTELDTETTFRKNYFEVLDLMINELNDRFNQEGLKTLIRLESLLLDALHGNEIPSSADIQNLLHPFSNDFEIDLLKTELKMLSNFQFNPRPETCQDFAEFLAKESTTVKSMLQQVVQLLIIVLTIPASAASAERSFSALRRLKTYLRSTMTQKRLTHVMLLHVHEKLTGQLDLQEIMREFVSRNDERKRVFGKV